ncbi:biotin/lipoyl-containing protein [Tropicimonas isoalkanivorans]|uniref:Pyruvate dehydrogenase E2 component (Dihydrolipoamide acetyltransferase) n=1 Tax=Tropicimonas isoalkanivorans TaxID=441112 RepID=A0A1I1DHS0_9RHOB|nr:biotin/lipoyl-containing protein [Tropicimonas isoalkanivorans]SFB73922.1 pyruvate dehydrogenase E2 component (dihydrolipoamide acetyltransferase) [Tropicimonas isoalkanivorans]
MPHEVIMPALGMAQDTGLIVAWHKSPGDAVAEGDLLFEVETDKATMEVEAQAAGFLSQIRRHAGDDVPVGDVIALIGESPEAVETEESPTEDTAPEATDLPEGRDVIMPTLGMAQDSGLLVAWHKAPGDAVAATDILFEVETDKSTVEVEAGHDGFFAALLAEAGEDVPVGEVIAVISDEKPDAPLQRGRKRTPAEAEPEPEAAAPAPKAKKNPEAPPKPATHAEGGRILASPKARRLAEEQGLDLSRLVREGHPQPYHVKDLEVLKSLPTEATPVSSAPSRRIAAEVPSDGFAEFAAWAAEHAGLKDTGALLAGLAGASLDLDDTVVALEALGRTRHYRVPGRRIGEVVESEADAPADLVLRDLRDTRITSVELGAEDCPVLTLATSAAGLSVTLECAGHHLSALEAVALLSNFAGRMEQPLRHLL